MMTSAFAQVELVVSENQDPLIQKWRSNFVIGSENYQTTLMQNKIELSTTDESPFGVFIEFYKNGTFVSYNQGWCGNECRVKVYGKYIQTTSDKVEFIVERIEYHKMCVDTPTKNVNQSLGIYSLAMNKDGYHLTRIDEN